MPPLDMTNPDVLKFFVENYEKTARLRMRWNHLHAHQLKEAATLQREEKGYYQSDVLKATMGNEMGTLTADSISGARNRRVKPIRDAHTIPAIADMRKGHSIVDVGLGDPKQDPRLGRPNTDLTMDPVMRPVDPKQKNIIYKGIPRFGRKVYLVERNKLAPENKYYFRESTGWTYGWRLLDSYFGRSAPKYGRVWVLTRGSASRSGPQPDPAHYNPVQQPGHKKCF